MIMETSTALMLTMLIPALAVVINLVLRNSPDLRDGLTFLAALATFGAVLTILYNEGNGTTEAFVLFEVLGGLNLAFSVEPLGLMFALLPRGCGLPRMSMAWDICAAIRRAIMLDFLPVFALRFSLLWESPLPITCSRCSCFMRR